MKNTIYDLQELADCISWNIDDSESMVCHIKFMGKPLFHFSMYEAIESCSRKKVLSHVAECDRTPWLKRWQDELADEVVKKLKGEK